MYKIKNFFDNDDIDILEEKGPFIIAEYKRDLSVTPLNAELSYFCEKMNVKKRQLVCDVSKSNIITQKGAMQWTVGNVKATTGIKGAGDLIGKLVQSKVTGETAIKPEYEGDGHLILEPTYKHIIILNTDDWNNCIVLDDGLFLACESDLHHSTVMRTNISSAAFGGEGLFNLALKGSGTVCIESPCPKAELIEIELENDTVKIDGNMAIAWSESLNFTTEKSGKTLLGSAVSGEGLVNVYRGTGKILLAPVAASELLTKALAETR